MSILHEVHTLESFKKGRISWNPELDITCQCSYCCGDSKLKYGLNIPGDWKSPFSWWVIKYWKWRYIRFTLPFLKFFKRK